MRATAMWAVMGVLALGCSESRTRDDDAGVGLDGGSSDGGGGAVDAGGVPCDAGPVAACFALRAEGGPGCCDVVVPPLCAPGGGFVCPAGSVAAATCTAFWADDRCASGEPRCAGPSECQLLPESCCGTCGAPTPGDMIAVHRARVAENRASACADPVACPECFMPTDPYLVATCRAGECEAVDLHQDALTTCSADAECTLAAATCCACGELGAGETIAYNPARGSLADVICDPEIACPPCVPFFEGVEARCQGGRCAVVPR